MIRNLIENEETDKNKKINKNEMNERMNPN